MTPTLPPPLSGDDLARMPWHARRAYARRVEAARRMVEAEAEAYRENARREARQKVDLDAKRRRDRDAYLRRRAKAGAAIRREALRLQPYLELSTDEQLLGRARLIEWP